MPIVGQKIVRAATNEPFWQTADGKTCLLYHGDVRERLRCLPAASVQCVVTSPPYWGLRDYGTGTWEGGDPRCDHLDLESAAERERQKKSMIDFGVECDGSERLREKEIPKSQQFKSVCGKCGARRIDQQLGSEPSPDCLTHGQVQCGRCFVCSMVEVFREVRRVLRDDGTCFVNLGDTYGGYSESRSTANDKDGAFARRRGQSSNDGTTMSPGVKSGLPSGNLVGIPWRVALALQADGWILRQDIIWAKPSPMPESVRNRCTKAHEYVFLLTKKMGYFYDAVAIKEKAVRPDDIQMFGKRSKKAGMFSKDNPEFRNGAEQWGRTVQTGGQGSNKRSVWLVDDKRGLTDWLAINAPMVLADYQAAAADKGDVWTVSSQGYPGAHFATFPPKLIEPMILAGTSGKGACADCGAPWRRIVKNRKLVRERPNDHVKRTGEEGTGNSCPNTVAGVEAVTVGWEPTCPCHGRFIVELLEEDLVGESKPVKVRRYVSELPLEEHPLRPCVVLDPFIGSGTTAVVSMRNGRWACGIDLSEEYLTKNAIARIEGHLLSIPNKAWLAGRKRERVVLGGKKLV